MIHYRPTRRRLRPPLIVVAALVLTSAASLVGASADHSVPAPSAAELSDDASPIRQAILGQLGGPAVAVGHEGDTAFMAVGSVVHSFVVAEPAQPVHIGKSDVMAGEIHDLVVSGGIVYVAHHGGLSLLDARDPVHLPVTDSWSDLGARRDVTVHDHYAFAFGSGESFRSASDCVLDVADPWNVEVVNGSWYQSPKEDFAIVGDRGYATRNFFLHMYDMSDPPWPAETHYLNVDDYALGVAADSEHVFVGRTNDLIILDAADPQGFPMPTPIPTPAWAAHEAAQDETSITVVPVEGPVEHIVLRGGLACLAAGASGGFRILDVSDITNPVTLAAVPAGDAAHVDLIDDIAYVSAGGDGVLLFDVSDPSAPRLLQTQPVTAWSDTLDVARLGTTAFVAAGSDGVLAVDMTDPAAPSLVGRLPAAAPAERLAVAGSLIYAVGAQDGGTGRLSIVDGSDPTSLALIGSKDTEGTAEGISVAGTLAFVADGGAGLRIVDVSDPARPQAIGRVGSSSWTAIDVVASGTEVYVVDQSLGLRVVDVGDLFTTREVARLTYFTGFSSRGIDLVGSRLFAVGSTDPLPSDWFGDEAAEDLLVVDVSDPLNPEIAEEIEVSVYPRGISAQSWRVLVASMGIAGRSHESEPLVMHVGLNDRDDCWSAGVPDGAWAIAPFDEAAAVAAGAGGVVSIGLETEAMPTATAADLPSPWATITRPPRTRTATPTREPGATITLPPTPTGLWYVRDRIYMPSAYYGQPD